ncbi:MAG TPA: uroporphyrinogen-III synthase [Terriglobia bacterium]|nr:uroporphyrinogen-III synthase [Terriglobia bacterium]
MTARPLSGRRIAVTRAREQSSALRRPLEELGADVVEIPTIEIRDPDSWEPLDRALTSLDQFDYLILTSVNGVKKLMERLKACGRFAAHLAHLQVGAIGPATAAELARHGVRVDFVPSAYRAEGLLQALDGCDLYGKAFLIPRAKVARDLVPRVLRESGARVEVVEAYQTALPGLAPGELARLLTPPPDIVTFTSSSTATNFARLLREHQAIAASAVMAASIGPVTSETARQLGFEVVLEPTESTIPGLVAAISDYFEKD